jgi:hypothetical protein
VLSKSVKCAMTHTASCFNQSSIGCDGEKFESKKCEDVRNIEFFLPSLNEQQGMCRQQLTNAQ